jgi:hypothetical protein
MSVLEISGGYTYKDIHDDTRERRRIALEEP